MTKQKPNVPHTKVPIIGEVDKVQGQEIVEAIMAQLRPVIDNILTAIDGLERRVNVVEEVKQLFPASINVIIKKEEEQALRDNKKEKK